jgi:cytochrome c5
VAANVPSNGPKVLLNGQAVYEGLCFGCHRDGLSGAPKFGDKEAWAPRIAHGFNTFVKHAIEGFTGKTGNMPPKGGGTYDNVEVARAVAYMANHAGASFSEPATFPKE